MPAPRNDRAIGLVACAALPMGISSVTTVAIKMARVLRAAQELLGWNRTVLCGNARSVIVVERNGGCHPQARVPPRGSVALIRIVTREIEMPSAFAFRSPGQVR